MKTLAFFFVLISPLLGAAEPVLRDSLTVKGHEYEKVKIINEDGESALVKHSAGISRIPMRLLDDDLQTQLGYDRKAADALDQKAADIAANTVKQQQLAAAFPVTITCIAVKFVERKYRWFFRITNHHQTPFTESLKISLLNNTEPIVNGVEVFAAKKGGIEPGLSAVVYFETNTGPVSVAGDYCIAKFRCEPMVAGKLTGKSATSDVPQNVIE